VFTSTQRTTYAQFPFPIPDKEGTPYVLYLLESMSLRAQGRVPALELSDEQKFDTDAAMTLVAEQILPALVCDRKLL
jgi:hypothetical protein